MDAADIGLMVGFGGAALGVAGGLLGTWLSIRSAKSPAERTLIVRWSIAAWAFVIAFMAALFFTPAPYGWLWWIPYPVILIWAIRRMNADVARVRQAQTAPPT